MTCCNIIFILLFKNENAVNEKPIIMQSHFYFMEHGLSHIQYYNDYFFEIYWFVLHTAIHHFV